MARISPLPPAEWPPEMKDALAVLRPANPRPSPSLRPAVATCCLQCDQRCNQGVVGSDQRTVILLLVLLLNSTKLERTEENPVDEKPV